MLVSVTASRPMDQWCMSNSNGCGPCRQPFVRQEVSEERLPPCECAVPCAHAGSSTLRNITASMFPAAVKPKHSSANCSLASRFAAMMCLTPRPLRARVLRYVFGFPCAILFRCRCRTILSMSGSPSRLFLPA